MQFISDDQKLTASMTQVIHQDRTQLSVRNNVQKYDKKRSNQISRLITDM